MPGSNFMESSPFLLLFLLGYCLAVIEGELRCYCNESGCVSTGYMCKSSAGQCFTAVEVRGEVTHQTHGCLDSLPQEHRESCRVGMDVVSATNPGRGTGHLPLLLCCKEHMCNYREDIDVSIILTPKYNGTFHRGSAPASEDNAIYSRNHHGNRDDDRDLWFKAAVIAVPIAGGFILVLLVLLAVRMLKTDSRHHRRLIQIRRERSLTKAHMYISDHFTSKGTKQHCSLFNEKTSKSCAAPVYSDNPANGSSINSSTSNSCPSSYFGDSSIKHHRDSLSNDAINDQRPDMPNSAFIGRGGGGVGVGDTSSNSNRCHASLLPCSSSSNYSDRSNFVTCSSKKGDNHSSVSSSSTCSNVSSTGGGGNIIVKPCSFHSDYTSKSPCLTRDSSIQLDKGGHTFVHPSGTLYSGPGHQHQHPAIVATWDKSCSKGPIAIV